MERMREKWTDERLDDLNQHLSGGFDRLDAELRDVRADLGAVRSEMNSRFEATQHLILQVGGGIVATMAIGFVSLLIAQH
jgi:phosphosulfolactate synthase (CoM biosynthesis protein A)